MKNFKDFKTSVLKGMHCFGEAIAVTVNSFLLLVSYLLGIGATSIVAKLVGKRFMKRDLDRNADTYWETVTPPPNKKGYYTRQF